MSEQEIAVLIVVLILAAVCCCCFFACALREKPRGTREGAATPLEAEWLEKFTKKRDAA